MDVLDTKTLRDLFDTICTRVAETNAPVRIQLDEGRMVCLMPEQRGGAPEPSTHSAAPYYPTMGHWEWDEIEDKCLHCSPELASMVGLPADEYVRRMISTEATLDLIHPDDRKRAQQLTTDLHTKLTPVEVEYRVLVNGHYKMFREKAVPVLDTAGHVVRSFGVVEDITDWHAAQARLRKSEESLRRAQRQGHIGSWEWDVAERRLIDCSDEFARIHGVEPDQVDDRIRNQMTRAIHPDDRDRVKRAFERFDKAGGAYQIEYRIVRPDGAIRHVLEIGETIRDEHGAAIQQTGILQDITERVEVEQALRRAHDELERRIDERTAELQASEAKFRALFENAAAGIGRSRIADGTVVEANRKLAAMLGFDDVETFIAEYRFADSYPTPDAREQTLQLFRDDPDGLHEETLTRRNGTRMPVRVQARIDDDAGTLDFVLIDDSERKLAESRMRAALLEAERANNAKSEFLATMSHDLRTPLNAIIGFSDSIRRELFGPIGAARYLDYADDIFASGAMLLSLINNILDLSKIEAGRFELTDSDLDVDFIVDFCLRQVEADAASAGIVLARDVPHHLPALRADRRAVIQMLNNLVSNAVKFTPSGGRVRVFANVASDGVFELGVADTGIGMSDQDKAKALDPFERADSLVVRHTGGTGLGLHIAKTLIEMQGGTLTLSSTAGAGTTAILRFPAERARNAA